MNTDTLKGSISKCYDLYVSLHKSHKSHPDMFSISRCNVILTAVMGGHRYGWRVVGITEKALRHYAQNDFIQRPGNNIRRAHITPRVETAKKLLTENEPLSLEALSKVWSECDVTVLCAEGENRAVVPGYIEFNNNECELFPGRQVGWRHSKDEIDFLKKLAQKHIYGPHRPTH